MGEAKQLCGNDIGGAGSKQRAGERSRGGGELQWRSRGGGEFTLEEKMRWRSFSEGADEMKNLQWRSRGSVKVRGRSRVGIELPEEKQRLFRSDG